MPHYDIAKRYFLKDTDRRVAGAFLQRLCVRRESFCANGCGFRSGYRDFLLDLLGEINGLKTERNSREYRPGKRCHQCCLPSAAWGRDMPEGRSGWLFSSAMQDTWPKWPR